MPLIMGDAFNPLTPEEISVLIAEATSRELAQLLARVRAGECVCCGAGAGLSEIVEWIAEGVGMCSYCVNPPHRDHREYAPALLGYLDRALREDLSGG